MMSKSVLFMAMATALLAGASGAASADPVKVVLKNVAQLPGASADATGTVAGDPQPKAAIPVSEALVDGSGNIVVSCNLDANSKCPNIGSGSGGGITGDPTLTFTVPSNAVAMGDTTTRLQWSATNADACYGVKIEKKNASGAWSNYTPPGGSVWSKEWPAQGTASTGYVLGNLGRSSTAGEETEYRFTMRCYSNTVDTVEGKLAVAIEQLPVSGTVRLASSASGGTPGSDYCSEYYPPGHPARSAPGFAFSGLPSQSLTFDMVFKNGAGAPVTFDVLIAGTYGRGGVPGPHVDPNSYYLVMPFTIPANIAANTGMRITFVEPQSYLGLSDISQFEASISPCPGDFRAKSYTNTSNDWYDRAYCRIKGGGAFESTSGTLTAPSGACFLKPGAVMYLNVIGHGLDNFRNTGGALIPGCPSGSMCGKKADMTRLVPPSN